MKIDSGSGPAVGTLALEHQFELGNLTQLDILCKKIDFRSGVPVETLKNFDSDTCLCTKMDFSTGAPVGLGKFFD